MNYCAKFLAFIIYICRTVFEISTFLIEEHEKLALNILSYA